MATKKAVKKTATKQTPAERAAERILGTLVRVGQDDSMPSGAFQIENYEFDVAQIRGVKKAALYPPGTFMSVNDPDSDSRYPLDDDYIVPVGKLTTVPGLKLANGVRWPDVVYIHAGNVTTIPITPIGDGESRNGHVFRMDILAESENNWHHAYISADGRMMSIGCQNHTVEQWKEWASQEYRYYSGNMIDQYFGDSTTTRTIKATLLALIERLPDALKKVPTATSKKGEMTVDEVRAFLYQKLGLNKNGKRKRVAKKTTTRKKAARKTIRKKARR